MWPQTSSTLFLYSNALVQLLKWQRGATQSLCTVGLCLHKLRDFHSNLQPNGKRCHRGLSSGSFCAMVVRQMIYLYYIHCGSTWCWTRVNICPHNGLSFFLSPAQFLSYSHSSARFLSQNNLSRLSRDVKPKAWIPLMSLGESLWGLLSSSTYFRFVLNGAAGLSRAKPLTYADFRSAF